MLRGALAAVGTSVLAMPALARPHLRSTRSVAFYNLHTEERTRLTYWADGAYIPDAMRRIDVVLRDHRNGAVHRIEPALVDLLHVLGQTLNTNEPFEVISGYRSPASNTMLISQGHGVAEGSLHLRGMAIDVRVPKRRLAKVRDAAKELQLGGVGYYPRSDFVHVDIGRVRYW
jgi:uncharacterized protein YcbK (DUF882 family)